MDTKLWKQIAEDYDKAKHYLYCLKKVDNWHREEDKGIYYLLKAYLHAKEQPEKDCLLYARILMTMYWEYRFAKCEYDLLNYFVKPAFELYNEAIQKNLKPTDDEIKRLNIAYNELMHNMNNYHQEESVHNAAIEGLTEITESTIFSIYDSEVISSCIDKNNATLVLDYSGILVELKFYDVWEFHCNIEIYNQYVNEFYCFRTYHDPDSFYFMLNCGYTIYCKRITATKIN